MASSKSLFELYLLVEKQRPPNGNNGYIKKAVLHGPALKNSKSTMEILISDNRYSYKLYSNITIRFCRTTRKSQQPSKKKVNKNFFLKKKTVITLYMLLFLPYVNKAEMKTKTASAFYI
jgi:hypothetical protein